MKNPYYIVAPRYTRTSAGVKVLYKLADKINKNGGTAFIYQRPQFNYNNSVSPTDIAPLLTKSIIDYHFVHNLIPIIIYPETINVSTYNAPIKIRYFLNYDQFLKSNENLDKDDYLLFYSTVISDSIHSLLPRKIIYIPISDPEFFTPNGVANIRKGGVFYAGKYKYRFNGNTEPFTNGMEEITRDKIYSQNEFEIRDLFRKKEFFYCYEDSALATEAILCGCTTVFIKNKYFENSNAEKDLGTYGYSLTMLAEDINYAKSTNNLAIENYKKIYYNVDEKVVDFINETQKLVLGKQYITPFAKDYKVNNYTISLVISYIILLREYIIDNGYLNTLKLIYKRLKFKRFKI